jgi:SAM-dependent methyltransferase
MLNTPQIGGANEEPAKPVILAASTLKPGRALDLACGSGRHARWLISRGWAVTAIDRNAGAVRELKEQYPAIDARAADLEKSEFSIELESWDLIVCWLYLQRELYPEIRDGLRPGGIAALCALLVGRYAVQRGELRSYFPDWTVLYESEAERTSELVVRRAAVK